MKYLISQSIDVLFLPTRLSNILKRHDVMTLEDFLQMSASSIQDLFGLGPSSRAGLVQLKGMLQSALTDNGVIEVDHSSLPLVRPIPPETLIFKEPEPVEKPLAIKVAPQDDFLVSELRLSVRARNALRLKGISLVSQIINLDKNDFLAFRNIGRSTAEELYQTVQQIRTQFISDAPIPTEQKNESEPVKGALTIQPQDDFRLEELHLSTRAINILHQNELRLFSQIAHFSKEDFLSFRRAGANTAEEIYQAVQKVLSQRTFCDSPAAPVQEDALPKSGEVSSKHEHDFLTLDALPMSREARSTLASLGINSINQFLLIPESAFHTDRFSAHIAQELSSLSKSLVGRTTDLSENEKELLRDVANSFSLPAHALMLSADAFKTAYANLSIGSLLDAIFAEPQYFVPSLADVLASLPNDRNKEFFLLRLQGKTLEEIATPIGLTRERVRQILAKYLRTFPAVAEDKYAYLFTTYDISAEDFALSFCTDPEVYEYLLCKYQRSKDRLPLTECQGDEKLPTAMRKQLEHALYKNYVTVDGVRLLRNRPVLIAYAVRKYAQEPTSFLEFLSKYQDFLAEYDLQDDSHLQINNQRTYTNHLSAADYVLWAQWQRFRYYDIKSRDFTDFLQELDLSQYKDIEITTLKIWREHPDLMQQYDIRDEYELHNLLRKILTPEHVSDLQLDFGKMPTLIFGKADRDMQVLEQLILYAPISVNDLGKRYEEAYGAKAGTAMGVYFKSIDTYFHDGVYRIDSKDLTHEQYQHMRSLMTEDIYQIDDVKWMYQRAYPDASVSDITPYTLKVLGYNVYAGYVIRDTFPNAKKYFQATCFSKDIFDATEVPRSFFNNQTFNSELHKCLAARDLTAYAPKQYINIHRLEQSGVTNATMEDYCAKVYDFVCARDLDIFTMTTLHKLSFTHELDDLGFDDYFYASVLSVDRERFDYCRIAGQWGFSPAGTYPAITRSTLIESIVRREGKIEIYDLVALCKEEYGILTNKDDVKLFIGNTTLYYDAIMQTVYANYDLYLEEF